MNLKMKKSKNFKGLLKKRKQFHFLNSKDLVRYFVEQHYSKKCVVVILNCKEAFVTVTKLNMLKRDDYSAYLLGLANEYVIIEFNSQVAAEDYVYSFPIDAKIMYLIFVNSKLVRTDKGKIK